MKQRKRKQRLNDWKLYGEKEPHDLSKRLPRNELEELRSQDKISVNNNNNNNNNNIIFIMHLYCYNVISNLKR